jgi:phage gpG-like protein
MASRIPWAGIHNEGGTANHGAQIPKRTFLEWTPDRVEMFAKMANDYILERAERAEARAQNAAAKK